MNMIEAYEWPLLRYADRVAVTAADASRTFREVDDRANALANALISLGVRKGDTIGMLLANEAEYLETEIAIAKAGAVRAPILAVATEREIRHSIVKSGARWIVARSERAAELGEIVGELERSEGIRVEIIVVGEAVAGHHSYDELVAGAPTDAPRVEVHGDDPWAIRFTGGTTGLPKAVLMSHRCGLTMINNMLINWEIGTGDKSLLSVHPLSHAAGLMMATFYVRGNRNVFLPPFSFDAENVFATIEREQINTMFLVPTGVTSLLDCPTRSEHDISSIEQVIFGGAPMAPARVLEANGFFGPVLYQVYGASETPMVCTTMLPADHVFSGEPPARLGSAGKPAYNVEVRIVDENDERVPTGEVGELVIRGDHTFSGYVGDPELTAARLRDGWVHTNDLARWGEDGYIYIVDRKEDMIITGGFNVYPIEVESAFAEHPGVAEAVVIGVPDDHWGEAVVGVVVARPDHRLDEAEVMAFVRSRRSGISSPKRIIVRDEPLPKSGVGKLLRRSVRDEYRG